MNGLNEWNVIGAKHGNFPRKLPMQRTFQLPYGFVEFAWKSKR